MTGKNVLSTVGRRKTSIARVRLWKGEGTFEVNGMDFKDYFERKVHRTTVQKPLEVTDSLGQCNVIVSVSGGGKSGQAGAICHGISRALLSLDSENRLSLKKNGFLTRDSRMVERKKYGRKGARKSFQFSKR